MRVHGSCLRGVDTLSRIWRTCRSLDPWSTRSIPFMLVLWQAFVPLHTPYIHWSVTLPWVLSFLLRERIFGSSWLEISYKGHLLLSCIFWLCGIKLFKLVGQRLQCSSHVQWESEYPNTMASVILFHWYLVAIIAMIGSSNLYLNSWIHSSFEKEIRVPFLVRASLLSSCCFSKGYEELLMNLVELF